MQYMAAEPLVRPKRFRNTFVMPGLTRHPRRREADATLRGFLQHRELEMTRESRD
jgi:hypothetical protein